MLSALAAMLLTPGILATSVTTRQAGGGRCRDVHVFLARGNNEPYPGRQGSLAGAICAGIESCDYEDIQFDNPLESPYCQALEDGVAATTSQIKAYNERCPDARLVVSGYSQGAHVLGDALGGGGGTFFEGCVERGNEAMDPETSPGNMIAAALLFGDTRHTAGQSYNYLSGAGADGLFPRPAEQRAGMNGFAGVLRAYCVETDPICAGGNEVETHLNYFDVYTDDAASWVQEMVEKAGPSSRSSAEPSSSTASSSSGKISSTEPSSTRSSDTESSGSASTTSSSTTAETTSTAASTTGATTTSTSTTEAEAAETSSDDSAAQSLKHSTAVLCLGFVAALMTIF